MNIEPFRFDVESEIEKIIRQLHSLPDQIGAPKVLASALNMTANEMKRKLGLKVRKRYAVTDTRVLKDKNQGAMFLQKATGASTFAALISKGPMLDVMAYMTRANSDSTAAMLKVLNSSNLTALETGGRKAFVTTFESGHTAIVQRDPSGQYSAQGQSKRAEKYGPYADMTKLKKLLAPAVPFLYGKSYEEAELDFYSILQKHIQRQIERTLGRRAA